MPEAAGQRTHCRAKRRKSAKESADPGATAYETARQFGLDYGPSFRLLKEARRIGERQIEVFIDTPQPAKNPYVTYNLHPISVDAVFHGLVALYADISGESRGAPYIPVRFGVARLFRSNETITRALIDIRRVSSGSIKADFTFIDKAGEVVAVFEDCRFKRTYLRQQKPLGDVSYHQTVVPSKISFAEADDSGPFRRPCCFPQQSRKMATARPRCLKPRSIEQASRLPARRAAAPAW